MPVPHPIIPYDPLFLGGGIEVPLPEPTEDLRTQLHVHNGSHVLDYTHFSLALHAERGTAIYSACNVDGRSRVMGVGRKGISWVIDNRAGDAQLGPEAYKNTAWNRGHLTRREDVIWGDPEDARAANRSTFYYTNAAPQHENFNQDEWLELEEWVLDWADREHYRLCVLTGPVLKRNDRRLSEGDPKIRREIREPEDIRIPAAYWKIVALRDRETRELAVAAFAMRQTDMWDDKQGRTLLRLTVHQVTVEAIEEWTDLSFGPLREADALRVHDPMERFARSAEGDTIWPIIRSAEDIVVPASPSGAERRLASFASRAASSKESGCGCEGGSEDVQSAIASLSDDVVRLTGIVAELARRDASESNSRTLRPTVDGGDDAPEPPPEPPVIEDESQLPDDQRIARVLSRVRMTSARTRSTMVADLVRIVGGEDVEPGEYPATCCLGTFAKFFCTGVLVHPRVVVTAAHCGGDLAYAFFGDLIPTRGGEGKNVRVKKVFMHDYRPSRKVRNDITVVILKDDAPTLPVKIASTAEIAAMDAVQLVGFGYNDPMKPLGFGQKRKVVVPIGAVQRTAGEDLSVLETTFGFSAPHEFVAGRKLLGRDSCKGDSGGPAYIMTDGLRVAGITSRATNEATVTCGDGGIYVRLDAYLDWIRDRAIEGGIDDFPN